MGLKILVDYDLCEANAVCMQVAPEIFEVDDDDNLNLHMEEVPDNLVYYALAETRQRMADEGGRASAAAVFAEAIRRIAGEHGCRLQLQATA